MAGKKDAEAPGDAVTEDRFLDGRLRISQPRRGYRAGVDAVILAAAVPAAAGERVLELGCGVGAASLCLGVRVSGVGLTGVEVQPRYAELARGNAARAGIGLRVVEADLRDLPRDLRSESFDHVITNPPYFRRNEGTIAQDAGRGTSLSETVPLRIWIDVALRRLRAGGWLTLIHRIERLPEVLAALEGRAGATEVVPLVSRPGRAPGLYVLRSAKARRTPFRLAPAVVMHERATHAGDGEDYAADLIDVLRNGAPFSGFSQS
ncbi:MAG: methyltransferase [Rhodobacteraceae bacterium]|nr:methyltransferase [Paracoccaceae bacterium]MCB1344464.1 methyltransferase [Paracoccaceae bacterium]